MRWFYIYLACLCLLMFLGVIACRKQKIDGLSLSSEERLGVVGCANIVQWQIEKPIIKPYVAKAIEDGKITEREYIEIAEKYFDAVHAEYIEKLRVE